MSYLPNEPTTFINIKLTDDGRRLLSLGQLTFNKAILSDREVNYAIDRTGAYDIGCCNRILSPKDSAPTFALPLSFDGSAAVPITVGSAKQIITAQTETTGFFTGTTTGTTWAVDFDEYLGSNTIDYATYVPDGTNEIILSGGGTGYFPNGGELLYVPWEPIQASAYTYDVSTLINSGAPFNNLWYRVLSADSGTSIVTLDRAVPDFGGTATTSSQAINVYFYPFNGVEDYYGSAATVTTRIWNMNIIRTSSVEGTNSSISGYTTYGSIEYNGTKQYLGFGSETRQFGVIHYTNECTGNTYAEQLVEKTVVVDIPNVMWHRYPGTAGQVTNFGIKLQDYAGSTIFDAASQTTYRELRDGSTASDYVVGRVYHKLKIIVITDPELLTALTYKANRSYTLPTLSLDSSAVPNNSCSTTTLDTSNTTGLMKSGYTYYVTYITYSDAYASGSSYGYPQSLPCQYIQKIDGVEDSEGNPQYLRAFYNTSFFPYLRNSAGMTSYSGTGWNTNKVQLLVNEVSNTAYPDNDYDNIPTDGWRLISSGTTGNGLYTGATGSLTIDPLNLAGFQFIVSQEDYDSGSTYVLNSTFYDNNDVNESGMTFGSESFFFGNIRTAIMATTYKSIMTVLAPDPNYNTSLNSSFDGLLDSNTYITEIGILNNSNVLVAVGKPTYPIKKNDSRYLAFQLEIDF